MRRFLAMALAGLIGATAAVVSAAPASAANVRYRAADSCVTSGVRFHADVRTWGKPTPDTPGVMTEVQLWGYRFERPVGALRVEARTVIWRDGAWQDGGAGIGYAIDPIADGQWHRGPNIDAPEYMGYITPTRPKGVLIRAYTGLSTFCRVILRPYDLYYTGADGAGEVSHLPGVFPAFTTAARPFRGGGVIVGSPTRCG